MLHFKIHCSKDQWHSLMFSSAAGVCWERGRPETKGPERWEIWILKKRLPSSLELINRMWKVRQNCFVITDRWAVFGRHLASYSCGCRNITSGAVVGCQVSQVGNYRCCQTKKIRSLNLRSLHERKKASCELKGSPNLKTTTNNT